MTAAICLFRFFGFSVAIPIIVVRTVYILKVFLVQSASCFAFVGFSSCSSYDVACCTVDYYWAELV